MGLLVYKDLNLCRVKAAIEAGDFRSAEVEKLNARPCYRAKLDYANRLPPQLHTSTGQPPLATPRRCAWRWCSRC